MVRLGAEVMFEGAFGFRTLLPQPREMKLDTVFDLSSLTKVAGDHHRSDDADARGQAAPGRSRDPLLPNFGVHGKDHITFRHLLAHCSGLTGMAAVLPSWSRDIERGGKVNFMVESAAPRNGLRANPS